jgi:hypothetical protein
MHAEQDALSKLHTKTYRRKTNNLTKVSIIAIRISSASTPEKYKLLNSRPCADCMYNIINTEHLGYRVSHIYFSDDNGDIIKYKTSDLVNKPQFVSTLRRSTNTPKKLKRSFIIE